MFVGGFNGGRRIGMSARALAIVASAAVAIGGCSAAPSAAGNGGGAVAAGSTLSPDQDGRPNGTIVGGEFVSPHTIAAVTVLTPGDLALTWQADERVRAQCMAARGFDYTEVPAPQAITADEYASVARDPSTTELEQYGYNWKQARRGAWNSRHADSKQAAITEPTTAEYATALGGNDADGGETPCVDVAMETLKAPEYGEAESVITDAFVDISNRVDADPQMADVLGAWVECMTTQGLAVTDNIDSAYLSQVDGQGGLAAGQQQVAVADYGCRDQVGYTQRRVDLINEQTDEWLNANAGAVAAYNEAKAEHLALAKQALQ